MGDFQYFTGILSIGDILICGTGVGISIAANKVKGVRAGVCSDVATAHLIKEHNNANIIAFGARIVGSELAKDIVKAKSKVWVNTLWASLCGGLDDDFAVESAENAEKAYGYMVKHGATLIQTDRPALLINYLRSKGLHE